MRYALITIFALMVGACTNERITVSEDDTCLQKLSVSRSRSWWIGQSSGMDAEQGVRATVPAGRLVRTGSLVPDVLEITVFPIASFVPKPASHVVRRFQQASDGMYRVWFGAEQGDAQWWLLYYSEPLSMSQMVNESDVAAG